MSSSPPPGMQQRVGACPQGPSTLTFIDEADVLLVGQRVALLGGRDLLRQHLRPLAVHSVEDEFLGWAVEGSQGEVRGGPGSSSHHPLEQGEGWFGCPTACMVAHSPSEARGSVAASHSCSALSPREGTKREPAPWERGLLCRERGAGEGSFPRERHPLPIPHPTFSHRVQSPK